MRRMRSMSRAAVLPQAWLWVDVEDQLEGIADETGRGSTPAGEVDFDRRGLVRGSRSCAGLGEVAFERGFDDHRHVVGGSLGAFFSPSGVLIHLVASIAVLARLGLGQSEGQVKVGQHTLDLFQPTTRLVLRDSASGPRTSGKARKEACERDHARNGRGRGALQTEMLEEARSDGAFRVGVATAGLLAREAAGKGGVAPDIQPPKGLENGECCRAARSADSRKRRVMPYARAPCVLATATQYQVSLRATPPLDTAKAKKRVVIPAQSRELWNVLVERGMRPMRSETTAWIRDGRMSETPTRRLTVATRRARSSAV
ncbi:hypothetical protein BJY59DRAFT_167168 [Rhodotorula toruloides]